MDATAPGTQTAQGPPPASSPTLAAIAGFVITATGWRQRGLAFIAGAVSTLAFAPFFCWPILFATFPVLFWLIDGAAHTARPIRAAALASWWFGFGYFFTGLIWIGEAFLVEAEIFAWLMPFAVTLLPAAMAIYWAIAGGIAARFWPERRTDSTILQASIARTLLLSASLGICEWLRGHLFTGFPWNTPGLALTMPLPFLQAVSVLGIYGLGLWTVFICTVPLVLASLIDSRNNPSVSRTLVFWGASLSGGPLALAFLLGAWHLSAPPSPPLANVQLRIVQPSVPQRDKWRGEKQAAIFADHLALSKQNAVGQQDDLAGITHLLWPEAAMPFGPLDHPEALAAIGQLLPPDTFLLAGALRRERNDAEQTYNAYNSLIVFGTGGDVVSLYDKIHLVPFGEYLPFQTSLEAIGLQSLTRQRGGFSRGPTPKPLLFVPGLPPIAPIICYEAIFPTEIVTASTRPGLLVIVTNDGWFGNSTGPSQHFHQARVRAVEQGLTVVRAANNGISGVIDPEGRILSTLALNARGSIDSVIPANRQPTLYAQFGDGLFWLNAFLFSGLALWLPRSTR
jgi:apolipoprotein N-acyltransferase